MALLRVHVEVMKEEGEVELLLVAVVVVVGGARWMVSVPRQLLGLVRWGWLLVGYWSPIAFEVGDGWRGRERGWWEVDLLRSCKLRRGPGLFWCW